MKEREMFIYLSPKEPADDSVVTINFAENMDQSFEILRRDPAHSRTKDIRLMFRLKRPFIEQLSGWSFKKEEKPKIRDEDEMKVNQVKEMNARNFLSSLRLTAETLVEDAKEKENLLTLLTHLENRYGQSV